MARRRGTTTLPNAETSLEPVINQEKKEEVANEPLVEEAVTSIRAKVAETIFQGAGDIGDYVLEKFFGNDPERVMVPQLIAMAPPVDRVKSQPSAPRPTPR